jgi:hypothetical protein
LPKEYGTNEIDLYNIKVDTGMSIRQQMTYEAVITVKPTFFSSIAIRGLIARDQGYKTFLGQKAVDDPKAPNLVQSQTGCIEGKLELLNGKLSLNAELDMGSNDTLVDTTSDTVKISKIAWYDPQVPEAISNVLRVVPQGRNYAFTLGASGLFDGYKLNLYGSQTAPSYFSAGNPYLEIDRRMISFTGEKDFSEKISANLSAEYQQRTLSVKPVDNTTVRTQGKYGFGQYLPDIVADYMFYYETSGEAQNITLYDTTWAADTGGDLVGTLVPRQVDSTYRVRDFKNQIGLEAKQQFANDMDYSLKYQLLLESDATKYLIAEDKDKRSGVQHQVSARYGFKIGKVLRNRTTLRVTTKNEALDSLNGLQYKISDDLKLNLIPRKLSVNLKGEYSNRLDKKVIDTTSSDPAAPKLRQALLTRFYGFETEVKYSLNAKWSFTLKGRYENAFDETPGSKENYSMKMGSLQMTYLF